MLEKIGNPDLSNEAMEKEEQEESNIEITIREFESLGTERSL